MFLSNGLFFFFNASSFVLIKVRTKLKGLGFRSPFSVASFLSQLILNFAFVLLPVLLKYMRFSDALSWVSLNTSKKNCLVMVMITGW